ncbi:hypothetical protein RI367_001057 [Sorochytrium milnesiophthora]
MLPTTFAWYIPDLILSVGIVVVQLHNIRCALRCFELKSLGKGLSTLHIAAFGFGALGGVVSIAMCIPRLLQDERPDTRVAMTHVSDTLVVLQTYFHAIVVLQRIHIVNAYAFSNESIDCRMLFLRWWPELVWSAGLCAMIFLDFAYYSTTPAYTAAVLWLMTLTIMDITISAVTFSKVHRMLNTKQTIWDWFRGSVRSQTSQPTTAVARSRGVSTGSRGDIPLLATNSSQRVVRAWLLVLLSIMSSGIFYLCAWWFGSTSDLWLPLYRASWLCGSVWQRGCLSYIEAIKQVALQNRVSKQYLGSTTRTGIAYETRT